MPRAQKKSLEDRNTPHEDPRLDSVLEFLRMIWALNHAVERTSIRMEEAIGLTAQQRFVIRILGTLPGISPAQLAELLHVDRGSVTFVIKRLEARKLVTRKANRSDGRRVSLFLTARGRKLDVPTKTSVEHAVAVALKRSHSRDIAAVKGLLGKLVEALDAVSAHGGSSGR